MQQDKMIINALEKEINFSLPPDFNERAMLCIYKEAEKKRKQNFFLMLGSISAASLALIALAIYLLKNYFSFQLQMPALKLGSLSQYYFSIYIAIIVLALLCLDYFFRTYWNKKNYERSIGQ